MADRFYHPGPLGLGDVTLDGPEAHHLANVRRFGPGDVVALFNGDGREYPATVIEVGKKRARLHVTTVETPDREIGFRLHLAAALPKGDRGDFLIEKLTELGVTDFTPLLTERGVVKADDAKAEKLRRAVIEASKQCGRNVLMTVHPPAKWSDWCRTVTGERYLAHPGAAARGSAHRDVTVAVGPEGGFADAEVAAAVATGWHLLSLGKTVLRVETAALAAAVWATSSPAAPAPSATPPARPATSTAL
ncbi:MAG TPA: 16S rRNA (uracil(1498)-N(3))-methyltransferase [Gemmataceae bacterium]|jgi:16S rRNA (uracil1498-N3)-methyltransferase|nr:16S rRNA (uracil(1498)-N(3))-methyltransferase [Gemmataceae bacterium]